MHPDHAVLGVLKPVGGGDPITLRKPEILIGRRAACDLVLDFENISGRHCVLRYVNGVWNVRDMGSTNGTTVNGQKIFSETSIMPEDQVGLASHIFTVEYEPAGPATSFTSTEHVLVEGEGVMETRRQRSLLELAGMGEKSEAKRPPRPARAPEKIVRLSSEEADFEDEVPEHFHQKTEKPAAPEPDDDFFKVIEEEVKNPKK